jgi:GT2 family glycosyltransferase
MNQPEFLLELADLLKKHGVAICCPGVLVPSDRPREPDKMAYSHIEFIHNAAAGSNHDERIISTRMHLTSYEIKNMYKSLKHQETK